MICLLCTNGLFVLKWILISHQVDAYLTAYSSLIAIIRTDAPAVNQAQNITQTQTNNDY